MPMIVTSRPRRATPNGPATGGIFRGRDYATYLPRPGAVVEVVDKGAIQGAYGNNTTGASGGHGFAVRGTSIASVSSTGLILPDGAFDLSGRDAYSVVAVGTLFTNNLGAGDAAIFRVDDEADVSRTQIGFSFVANGSTMEWRSLVVTNGGVSGWTTSAYVADTAPPVGRLLVMATRWSTSGRIESMWSVAGSAMRKWVSAAHNPTGSVSWNGGGFASQLNAHIGGMAYSTGVAFPGDLFVVSVLPFRISDMEAAQVVADPFTALFGPVRRPVFFASAGGVYDVALSEVASASDSLGAAGALTAALAEAASAADIVSAAAAFAAAMSEFATATDGTAAVSVVLGALTEGGTGVDTLTSTISGAGVHDVALLESATTADAETAGGVFYVSVSEQGVGSEALSTGGVFYVTLADSGTGTDVFSGHLPTSFSAALSESVSALDVMVSTIPSAGTLWTAMDTAAASGWTAVVTTTNTWTIVPTT